MRRKVIRALGVHALRVAAHARAGEHGGAYAYA